MRISDGIKISAGVLRTLSFFIVISPVIVLAEKTWYPLDVDVWIPPFNDRRQQDQKLYIPLDKARKKWRVRVFIPHLKDAYWLGVNYGLIGEARRLGIRLAIYEAGGYGQLDVQRRQIEDSLKEKPDGLIIGAITAAPSDLTVLQARIAVDVMVRIIEKKAYYKHVAPMVTVVDRDNIRTWDSSTTLAPRGFRPIFSINEQ